MVSILKMGNGEWGIEEEGLSFLVLFGTKVGEVLPEV
jgi:hypothetical protein